MGGKKVSIYKGDYKPVTLQKNATKLSGFSVSGTNKTEAIFEGTYNDSLTLYGKSEFLKSPNLCPNLKPQSGAINPYSWQITPNIDGTFNFSGAMVTGETVGSVKLPAGTYTASGCKLLQLYWDGIDGFLTLPATFTLSKETTILLVLWYTETVQISLENQYIQIEMGENATRFIPYSGDITLAPSPNNYLPIMNSKGSIFTSGKNLINADLLINEFFTKNSDGSYTQQVFENKIRNSAYAPVYIPANRKVAFSAKLLERTIPGSTQIIYGIFVGESGESYYKNLADGYPTLSITFPEPIVKMRVYLPSLETVGKITIKDLSISVSGSQGEYEPYFGSSLVDIKELCSIEVDSKCDYTYSINKDNLTRYFVCDTMSCEKVKCRIGSIAFTGQEEWVKSENEKCFYLNLKDKDITNNPFMKCLCTHFKGTSEKDNEVGIICSKNIVKVSQGFEDIFKSSLTEFKSFLSEQNAAATPVTLYYVLENPQNFIMMETSGVGYKKIQAKTYPKLTCVKIIPDENRPAYGLENAIKITDN